MNETTEQGTGQPQPEGQPQANVPPFTNGQSASDPGAFESMYSALSKGAQQARSAAEKAVPKVKAAASDAAYWVGFGVSFATVFSCILIKELIPAVVITGCQDGARAGKAKAEDFTTSLKQRHTESGAPPVINPAPASPEAQTGLA